jgi:altronate hydrolase
MIPDGGALRRPSINDNAELAEMIACSSRHVLYRPRLVGRLSLANLKVCTTPRLTNMSDDMDVDAGRSWKAAPGLSGRGDLRPLVEITKGADQVEALGHQGSC